MQSFFMGFINLIKAYSKCSRLHNRVQICVVLRKQLWEWQTWMAIDSSFIKISTNYLFTKFIKKHAHWRQ